MAACVSAVADVRWSTCDWSPVHHFLSHQMSLDPVECQNIHIDMNLEYARIFSINLLYFGLAALYQGIGLCLVK